MDPVLFKDLKTLIDVTVKTTMNRKKGEIAAKRGVRRQRKPLWTVHVGAASRPPYSPEKYATVEIVQHVTDDSLERYAMQMRNVVPWKNTC